MKEQIQAIVTVLSLVNPTICALMFMQAETDRSDSSRFADATKAALAILAILVATALAGTNLLHAFGVSLDAFMVAGGGVLAWMGFSMLKGETPLSNPSASAPSPTSSVTPLILFAASPGTMTGVITISAAHTQLRLPTTALVAVAVAVVTTWIIMIFAARLFGQRKEGGFLQDTMSRLMGLIVLAMGVQFALTGAHAFSP